MNTSWLWSFVRIGDIFAVESTYLTVSNHKGESFLKRDGMS